MMDTESIWPVEPYFSIKVFRKLSAPLQGWMAMLYTSYATAHVVQLCWQVEVC